METLLSYSKTQKYWDRAIEKRPNVNSSLFLFLNWCFLNFKVSLAYFRRQFKELDFSLGLLILSALIWMKSKVEYCGPSLPLSVQRCALWVSLRLHNLQWSTTKVILLRLTLIERVVWFAIQRTLCFKYALPRGENCLQRPDRFQHFFFNWCGLVSGIWFCQYGVCQLKHDGLSSVPRGWRCDL